MIFKNEKSRERKSWCKVACLNTIETPKVLILFSSYNSGESHFSFFLTDNMAVNSALTKQLSRE